MVQRVDGFPEPIAISPETLSIMLQGGLSRRNLAQSAHACLHWRELLPNAEIVFSISVTDVVIGRLERDRTWVDLELAPACRHDGQLQVALETIVSSCDRVVLSEGGLPLPKFKKDSRENNVNLQIAAAKAGLNHATRPYVLRTRSDFLFLDDTFLGYYAEHASAARLGTACLKQRVMVSEIFTLNPYTIERMPLHFSDWFHLGLTGDVRRLWDVPPMSLRDDLHYRVHPHAPGSNGDEKLFNSRLADEQHILFSALKRDFGGLELAFHNDLRSRELSMEILLDNFLICDLRACKAFIDKYMADVLDPKKDVHCIRAKHWRHLAAHRGTDYEAYFADAITQAQRISFLLYDPGMQPVKRMVKYLNKVRRIIRHAWAGARSVWGYRALTRAPGPAAE